MELAACDGSSSNAVPGPELLLLNQGDAAQQVCAPDRLPFAFGSSFAHSAAGELGVGPLAHSVYINDSFDMESAIIKWREPREVRQKKQAMHSKGRVAIFFHILNILIACCVLFTTIYYLVHSRYDYLYLMLSPFVLMWVCGRVPPTYSIGDDGLRFQDGFSRKHYKWSDIEWFAVESPPQGPGVSYLRFKVRKAGKFEWPFFFFDRQQIDEQALRDILNRHLPLKKHPA